MRVRILSSSEFKKKFKEVTFLIHIVGLCFRHAQAGYLRDELKVEMLPHLRSRQ